MRKNILLVGLIGLLSISLVACSSNNVEEEEIEVNNTDVVEETDSEPEDQEAEVESSTLFKDLDTEDLNGETYDYSFFEDKKLTMVNTWNIGCPPCVAELPVLAQISEEYQDQEFAVLGLYFNGTPTFQSGELDEIQKMIEEAGADYPHLKMNEDMLQTEEMSNLLGVPTTFFVNRRGEIVDTEVGAHDYETWKSIIDSTLEEVAND